MRMLSPHPWVAAFFLFALLPSSLLAGEEPKDEARDRYEYRRNIYDGAQFLRQGEPARALARFNHAQKLAQKLGNETAEVYYWKGLAFSDMENYGTAAKNAAQAVLLNEEMAEAWLLWGQCLVHMRQWTDAREKLERAFSLDPRNALASFHLGLCYYYGLEDRHRQIAKRYFMKSVELDDRFAPARLYLGRCYLEADIPFLAAIEFKQAIQLDPQSEEAHFGLGVALRRQNRLHEAEQSFLEALRLQPRYADCMLHLAHLYHFDLAEKEKAIPFYRQFLESSKPDHPWRKRVEKYLAESAPAPSSPPSPR